MKNDVFPASVQHRSCGPMDKASAYGAGDCRFESYQDHFYRLAHGSVLTFRLRHCSNFLVFHRTSKVVCCLDDDDDDDDVGLAAFLHGDHAV